MRSRAATRAHWARSKAGIYKENVAGVTELRKSVQAIEKMARVTGLEPATSGVTGRRSNQLSYTPVTKPQQGRSEEGRHVRHALPQVNENSREDCVGCHIPERAR
jgi:hypothetical protein